MLHPLSKTGGASVWFNYDPSWVPQADTLGKSDMPGMLVVVDKLPQADTRWLAVLPEQAQEEVAVFHPLFSA